MIRITTESGSVYEMDTAAQTVRRVAGATAEHLRHDNYAHRYHEIVNGPAVGEPFIYMHFLSVRYTTPVVSIEDAER